MGFACLICWLLTGFPHHLANSYECDGGSSGINHSIRPSYPNFRLIGSTHHCYIHKAQHGALMLWGCSFVTYRVTIVFLSHPPVPFTVV